MPAPGAGRTGPATIDVAAYSGDPAAAPESGVNESKTGTTCGGTGQRWWLLAVVALVWFVVLLDDTAVTIAVPLIGRGLRVGPVGLEWVVNAYTITFAVCTLIAGSLADRLGARPIFLAGVAVFTVASLAAGLSTGGATLIAARAVQGGGAAMIGPTALAALLVRFTGPARGLAIGVWSGVAAGALAGGPLLGAVLATSALGWRGIFLINVPLGLAALPIARAVLPAPSPTRTRGTAGRPRFDAAGTITSAVGLFALVYALTEANTYGWSSFRFWAILAVAVVSLSAFWVIERHTAAPLLDPVLLRTPNFASGNVLALINLAIMCSLFFYVSLFLQTAAGASTLRAGLALLPLTVLSALLAPAAGAVLTRVNARWLIVAGMGALALGLAWLTRIGPGWGPGPMQGGLLLSGLGLGIASTPITAAALGHVPSGQSGMAAATINSARTLGLSLGVALMGAIVASQGPIDAATAAGRRAFAAGIATGLRLDVALALSAALVAAATIRIRNPGTPERVGDIP